ncbi:hypothetical protein A6V36_08150 [Paraburkholderia ginsengiterrae]|uniref:Uncharacterized protein n=1 Tax=Paraburkholderia ginsengiterrae TaxID=1462993 RepID=A0A1A9N8R8_9BURK|nr:hypothetical protein [Paraburkholderia ginsengiterrae]OAJ54809.1 hypothetical protein A6V36_08150 [Paraburkholderia ginsengiterrae]OAJ60994.1 hypothetical protein A6V37_02480 [Paraburkholderia ginsengiterrae]
MEQKVIVVTQRTNHTKDAPSPAPLPAAFDELSRFVDTWALPTETGRMTQRHTVGMAAIVEFKDAMLARVDDIVAWLNQFELHRLPEDAKTLMYLLLSLAEVAPAVEFYQQPFVIDGYDPFRFVADETFSMRPAI